MKPADNLKRFFAFLIDCIVAMPLCLIPHLGLIAGTAYFLLRDGMGIPALQNRSVGKSLLKLKVISSSNGQELTTWQDSLKRNCIFIVPFSSLVEGIILLRSTDGKRLGDKVNDSLVVEV